MFKALDYGIVVREFEHESRYYVHFRTNTLGKDMNPLSSQLYHYRPCKNDRFDIKQPEKVGMLLNDQQTKKTLTC